MSSIQGGLEEKFTLKDGKSVIVCLFTLEYLEEAKQAFANKLSQESRFLRFLIHANNLTSYQWRYLSEVDQKNHTVIIALNEEDHSLIGGARYVKLPEDSESAEVAITVIDSFHNRGVGTLLVEALIKLAQKNNFKYFKLHIHPTNEKVIGVLRKAKIQLELKEDLFSAKFSLKKIQNYLAQR